MKISKIYAMYMTYKRVKKFINKWYPVALLVIAIAVIIYLWGNL